MTKRQRTRARRRAAFLALGELQRGFILTDEQKREALHAKGGEMDHHEVEADENIRLELYRALVAAVGFRMMVLEALERREEPASNGAGHTGAI